jgi:uncharacterized membrane protein YdjX (TVP38/TMEM64 family)
MKHISKPIIIISLFSILCIISIFLSFQSNNQHLIQQYLQTIIPKNYFGATLLFLILLLATSIGLPRQIAAFSSGYLFGVLPGTVIATLAAIAGCSLTLILSQCFLHNFITKKYYKQTDQIGLFFAQQTFTKALIIRLLPAGSNFITNVIAGVVKVPRKAYLLGTGIGFIPQMFIFSLAGSGVRLENNHHIILSVGLCLIAFLLGSWLYRNSIKDKEHSAKVNTNLTN